MNEPEQLNLLDVDPDWRKEWQDMPEFVQEDQMPFKTIYIHFKSLEDMKSFAKLIEQNLTLDTAQIWYPKIEIGGYFNKRYVDES